MDWPDAISLGALRVSDDRRDRAPDAALIPPRLREGLMLLSPPKHCPSRSRTPHDPTLYVRDAELEFGESLGVQQSVDLTGLSFVDGEGHDCEQLSVRGHDGACRAVDERRHHERIQTGVGGRVSGHGLSA